MRIASLILLLGALAVSFASDVGAFGLGRIRFGNEGSIGSKPGVVIPPPTGKILLVDAASFLLQTGGASKVCRAGGC